jgi:prepilin-type N-terminal cleavage/methylation domain-containing protein
MKEPQSGRSPSGFTLIEMLVVMALLIILILFAVPTLQTVMRQGKLRGIANETATLMRRARLEAIKRSCPSIVRMFDVDGTNPLRMEGFPDCDRDGVLDADKPTLGSFPLPSGVHFLAPPDLRGKDSVAGFSPDPAGGAANVAIFQPDGSIQAIGGFRFGDDNGNFLEVWVDPAATARTEVHKCRLCTNADLRADWYASGDGGEVWEWK